MKANFTSKINLVRKWTILLYVLSLLFSFHSQAQTWQWGNLGGADDNLGNPTDKEQPVSMCTAANGDTYLTSMAGRIDLRVAGNLEETYSSFGLNDWVVAGFSCEGNYKWSKVLGGYLGAQSAYVVVDSQNNVYVACHITRTAPNVSPSPHLDSDVILGTSALTTNTFKETIYLIKYDSSGNYLWSRTPQAPDISRSTGSQAGPLAMDIDASGNCYMLCLLTPSTYGGQYVVATKGFHMLKYDKDGNFIGAFPLDMTMSSAPYDFKMKLDRNSGRIYLGGEFNPAGSSNLRFGGQPVTHSKYIAAFDPTGNLVWEKENSITTSWGAGGISYDVAVDSESNIYFIGASGYQLGDTSIIDSFNGTPFVNYGSTPWPFIVKLDPAGNTLWQTNGANSSLVGVAVNGNEVGVTCGANQMVWQNVNYNMPAGAQPYIARFQKSSGEIIGINRLTTTGSDAGTVLTADAHGNYYLGGSFAGTLTAGPDAVTSNGGDSDFFIAKFGTDNCDLATQSFQNQKLNVYPNPVHDRLFIADAEGQFKIYNTLGSEMISGTLNRDGYIDVGGLSPGVYLLQVSGDGKSGSVKVVKY